MQTNPAVEQNKTLNGPLDREISPVGKEKVYGGNDLVKSQVLSIARIRLVDSCTLSSATEKTTYPFDQITTDATDINKSSYICSLLSALYNFFVIYSFIHILHSL